MFFSGIWMILIFILKSSQNEDIFYVNQDLNNNFQNGSPEYPYKFLDFFENNDIISQQPKTTIFLFSDYNETKTLNFFISHEANFFGTDNVKFKNEKITKFEVNNGILRIENISFYSCVVINQNGGEILFNNVNIFNSTYKYNYFLLSEGARNITLQNIKISDIVFFQDCEHDFVTIRAVQNVIFLKNIFFRSNSFYNCSIFNLANSDLFLIYFEIINTTFESHCQNTANIFLSLNSNLIFYKLFQINNIFSNNIKILTAIGSYFNNFTLSLFYAKNLTFKKPNNDLDIFHFNNFLQIIMNEIFFWNVDTKSISMFQIINVCKINIDEVVVQNTTISSLFQMNNIKFIQFFNFFIAELISLLNNNSDNAYAIISIRNPWVLILQSITLCLSTINLPYLVILIDNPEEIFLHNHKLLENKMVQKQKQVTIGTNKMFINLSFSKIDKITRNNMNLTNFLIFKNSVNNEKMNQDELHIVSEFIFINFHFYSHLYLLNFNFIGNFAQCDGILLKLMGENLQIFNSNFIDNQSLIAKYLTNILLSSNVFFISSLYLLKNAVGTSSLIQIENSNSDNFFVGIFEKLMVSNNTSFYSQMNFNYNLEEFKIQIINSSFYSNYCLAKGGVIQTSYFDYNSILIFFNCRFKNNIAYSFGGVFYFANLGNNIIINNTNFINNSIKKEGGGVICVYGDPNTKITMQNCYFENNLSPKKGGVYLILTGNIYDESSIYNNNSASEGGVIAIHFFSVLLLININNLGSTAFLNSGFLKMMGQSEVQINNSRINYSFAPKGGLVVTGGMSLLSIKNSTFFSNSADDASFLYAANSAFLILIQDCVFMKNYGKQHLFEITSSSINFSNCIIRNNSIDLFKMELTNLKLDSTIIENNICQEKRSGCLIYMISNCFVIAFKLFASNIYSIFDENGIMYAFDSNLQISDSYFENWKQNLGGSSFYATNSNFSIQRILIFDYDNRVFSLSDSLFVFENSSIVQNNNKMTSSKNLKGAISCLQCKDFQLISSLIKGINNLEVKSGAVHLIESNGNFIFQIKNSIILENNGLKGGGLYIENISINIMNSNFTKNFAESGGAIYFYCNYNRLCKFKMLGNYFSENRANLSGGAVKWLSNTPVIEKNNTFFKNEGLYGENISSQPVRLISDDSSLFKQFLEFQSGNVSSLFEFCVVDFYGQKIKDEAGFGFTDFKNSSDKNYEKNVVQVKANKISFNKIRIVGTPNSNFTLLISTSIIEQFFDRLINQTQNFIFQDTFDQNMRNYHLALNITLRDCIIGEIYIPDKNICQECPFYYFSLNRNDTLCQICPENALCEGGSHICILPGFWRENVNTTKIYSCRNSNACLGGFNSTCRFGYTGPLCDVCLINDINRFYKFGQGVCENCEDMNFIGLIIILLFSSSWVFYLIFTIRKNIQLSKRINTFSDELPILLKIGADYFQIISSFFLLDVALPLNFSYVFRFIEQIISLSSILFPFECILAEYSTFVNIFFLKLFLGSFVAWSILLLSISFWLVYICVKKRAFKYLKTEIIITTIIVGFSLQSPLISLYFTSMNCVEINEVKYLKSQLILECWESEHLQIFFLFIFPSILLWAILLPFICWIYVSKNINSMNLQTQASLVFITEGFRKKYYYWEFLLMTKRLLINIFTVFFQGNDEILCVSIILLILYFFSIFFFNSNPYKHQQLNTMYATSIYSSDIIYIFSLLCLILKHQIISLICLIFIFFGFMLFIWKFARYYYFASKQNLKELVKKLSHINIMRNSNFWNILKSLTERIHIIEKKTNEKKKNRIKLFSPLTKKIKQKKKKIDY